MLQQTQVARVAEYFPRFIARFPSVESLAEAPAERVLELWAGLGYYRRARHLHAAAKAVVREHGGVVPGDVAALRKLPGVGRYTAGAIASIAFGRAEPIVDGNVARVLIRLEGKDLDPKAKGTVEHLWTVAAGLVRAAKSPGAINEGLMELGATVCLPAPATPRCAACPVAEHCGANRLGNAADLPRPRVKAAQREVFAVATVYLSAGRVLLERRPTGGMWGGMWQVPTVETARGHGETGAEANGGEGGFAGAFIHQTTHRRFHFAVRVVRVARAREVGGPGQVPERRWVKVGELKGLAMGSAQRKVLALAGVAVGRERPPRRGGGGGML
jgi:A/G-specific adenine glycosylase